MFKDSAYHSIEIKALTLCELLLLRDCVRLYLGEGNKKHYEYKQPHLTRKPDHQPYREFLSYCGICAAVSHVSILHAIYPSWAYWTGNTCYPIPNPDECSDDSAGYIYNWSIDQWANTQTDNPELHNDYIELRYHLLNHLITYLESDKKVCTMGHDVYNKYKSTVTSF